MAYYKEHCADCRAALGKDWAVVHRWLDELWPVLGPKHRSARHHDAGVEEVRRRWGDEAAKAAEIHIKRDWYGKVPSETEAHMWSFFGPPSEPVNGQTFLTDDNTGNTTPTGG